MATAPSREQWTSRWGFLLATVGAAVGLGNFWRFPYMAGENGGGAFVLVYLACVLLIAVPLAMTELMIGRRGQASAPTSPRLVAVGDGKSPNWAIIGWMGAIATFLIVTFYSVIGGWVISYVVDGVSQGYSADPQAAANRFDSLLADPVRLIIFHTIFIALTAVIPARGLQSGIERGVNIMMPLLFVLTAGLLFYGMTQGGFGDAVRFLFAVDFSKLLTESGSINGEIILSAIGQAFFSVGVGMAILLTYGSYLKRDTNLPRAGITIALADTGVAIVAGLVIFPIVFANGLDPAAGPGLVFVTLPIAFGQMAGGTIIGIAFFVLLLVAALTSSIAIMEIVIAWASEKGMTRGKAAFIAASVIWALGLGTVFSFNIWSGFYPLNFIPVFEGKTIFDVIDFITANIMLTGGGLLIAIFGGWFLSSKVIFEEFGWSDGPLFRIWQVLMRFVIPPIIVAMMISALF